MKQDYLQIRALELAPQVYVTAQLYASDLQLLAKQGVRSIMSNRPDNESPGQPPSGDLADVAESLGMAFVYFPMSHGAPTRQDVEAFAKACEVLGRPLVVFSRTGARSTRLWEASESL